MKAYFKYRLILLILLSHISGSYVLAQSPQLNEEKYWDYRDRLRNEFLIGIGPEMGQSIPASVRDTISGILQWTDCTMALGEYIGVLAMEYKILDEESGNIDQTVKELFYALYALNRLDHDAEFFYGGTKSLNGFFMRDDIEEDSLDMQTLLEHLNQGLPEYKITNFDSDYMDENPRNNEESLDQAILLITGLSLVSKCVPEDVVYIEDKNVKEFQDFETSLTLEAKNIITRIVNYMKEGDSTTVELDPLDPNLYGIQGLAWDFIIKNPVTMIEVLRGGNAFLLSKGFTSAKYHATGQFSFTTDITNDTLASAIFLVLEGYIVPNDQDFKVINLNAMSNYWPDGLMEDTTNTEYNSRILGPRSQSQDYEWIPMLHQLMFGGVNNYLMSALPPDTIFYNDPGGYYEYLLNLAPAEGPYNYNDSIYPNWEWSSTSRTIQPSRRGETNTSFTGNYNGLDYMIYYNMHKLLFEGGSVIAEEYPQMEFSVYPNPCSEYLVLEPDSSPLKLYFTIITLDGKEVAGGRVKQGEQTLIDTGHFSNGVYLLRMISDDGLFATKKIVKTSK